MYNITDIKVVHLEVTSKCQARCPMCARNIQGGPISPFLELHEITIGQFTSWFSKEFIQQLDRIYLCGNFGDPIIAKDSLEILTYIRNSNPNIAISMNTNGSARTEDFWKQLAALRIQIRFGIDGLSDTHARYRINTDWNKIIENATTFINSGGYAIWDMLLFEHNEHQVDACRKLSQSIGFAEFHHKNTSRFRNNELQVIDIYGKQVDVLKPTTKSLAFKNTINKKTDKIGCKAQNEKSIYIGANGNITPCCWTDLEFVQVNHPNRIDIMSRIGMSPNLHKSNIDEVFNKTYFKSIENTWAYNPLNECTKQCGSFKKFEAQYES